MDYKAAKEKGAVIAKRISHKTKNLLIAVSYHALILLNALIHMAFSTLTITLFVIAIAGFCLVAREGGYVAVFDFICSCAAFAVAVAIMYFHGIFGKNRGGRYVEEH